MYSPSRYNRQSPKSGGYSHKSNSIGKHNNYQIRDGMRERQGRNVSDLRDVGLTTQINDTNEDLEFIEKEL